MKFSLATQRGKNASLEENQPQKNASNVPSVAWAIAAIAWAIAIYLIERERQWAQVEVARLELEAKKQRALN